MNLWAGADRRNSPLRPDGRDQPTSSSLRWTDARPRFAAGAAGLFDADSVIARVAEAPFLVVSLDHHAQRVDVPGEPTRRIRRAVLQHADRHVEGKGLVRADRVVELLR